MNRLLPKKGKIKSSMSTETETFKGVQQLHQRQKKIHSMLMLVLLLLLLPKYLSLPMWVLHTFSSDSTHWNWFILFVGSSLSFQMKANNPGNSVCVCVQCSYYENGLIHSASLSLSPLSCRLSYFPFLRLSLQNFFFSNLGRIKNNFDLLPIFMKIE